MSLDRLATALSQSRKVVVITGAGVSAESGIATFRGNGGYWDRHKAEDLASPAGFARDPELVWRWYDARRRQVLAAEPNPAHAAIAELERLFPAFLLITQNVDGLHQRAGSRQVIDLHGSILRVRCQRSGREWEDRRLLDIFPLTCTCGALLRPAVLWFGETYDPDKMQQAIAAVRAAEHVLVIGTSGLVWIVDGLLAYAEQAMISQFNLEPTPLRAEVAVQVLGPAGESLPALLALLSSKFKLNNTDS